MTRKKRRTIRPPRQARARRTVESILTATAQLLVRTGRVPTTNQVAVRAGVGVASVYEYFRNKEDLLDELRRRHVQEIRGLMREAIGRVAGQPLPLVTRALVQALLDAHAVAPDLHRALSEHASRSGESDSMDGFGRELVLAYLREHGRIDPTRVALAATLIGKTAEALTHHATLREPALLRKPHFVDEVTELLLGYIRGLEARG